MSKGIIQKIHRLALPGLCLVAMSAFAPMAHAQTPDTTEAASQDNICAADRFNGAPGGTALNCTANDYVVTATSMSNTIMVCHQGDTVVVDVDLGITSAQTDRYDVGYWIGQAGNDPHLPGGMCSIATFPTTPTGSNVAGGQWFDANGNQCGDYNKASTTANLVTGVKVLCQEDSNHNLVFPYTLTYGQNVGGTCMGPGDVVPGTTSKCQAGAVPVTNVNVQYNANPTCTFTGGGLGLALNSGSFTKTFRITNSGPDDVGAAGSQYLSYSDPVPMDLTVTGVACGNEQGGAACGAGGASNTGNDVSGIIDTMPVGGSVDITITGTYTPSAAIIDNVVTLAVNTDFVVVPTMPLWQNTCDVGGQLPVKLQNFDVH